MLGATLDYPHRILPILKQLLLGLVFFTLPLSPGDSLSENDFSLKIFPEQGKDNWSVILECFTRGDQNFISLLWPILRQSSRLFLKLSPKLVQGLMQLNWQHCIRLQFSNWCQHEACQSPLAPAVLVVKMLQLIIMALKKALWLVC